MVSEDAQITVVVATYNRPSVNKTVESLLNQTIKVNIIVVDDGSLMPFVPINNDIRVLRNDKPKGLSVCRNMGWQSASASYIAFIDDDAIASKTWAEELLEGFNSGYDIIGGTILPISEGKRPFWLHEFLFGNIAINPFNNLIFGCNFALKKEILEKIDGFVPSLGRKKDNIMVGDETELFFRALKEGYKIKKLENAIVYHQVPIQRLALSYHIKRVFWEGRTERRRNRFIFHLLARISLFRYHLCYVFIDFLLLISWILGTLWEYFKPESEYK